MERVICKVKSENGDSLYEVKWDGDRHFTCSCPHFYFRLRHSRNAECKHIRLAKHAFGSDWYKSLTDEAVPTLDLDGEPVF